MVIQPRAKAYINSAPDAQKVKKGNKLQISLTISKEILNQVDEVASNTGQSRAAIINMAIVQALQTGLKINL